MMWDLGGPGGSHTSARSIAMPIPSTLSVPKHHHGHHRSSSVPGPPSPGWSAQRLGTPVPGPVPVPTSFTNFEPGSYHYEPTPRGFLHPQSQPRQEQHHHRHQHHSPSPHSHHAPQQPQHHHHHQQPPQHHTQVALPVPSPVQHHMSMPHFMYSKCTGRRRALCIGINYHGQSHELRGCINDAKHVFSFLVRHAGYKPENIVMLTDDSPHARSQPTRTNMIDAMRWLVQGAKPHDALFFHYSGHGGQTRDKDGDEVDGYDEVIYPLDYQRNGHIVDDEMHDIMVHPLPTGCRLTAIFDSCHSGTVLDLPYVYDHHGRLKGRQVTEQWRTRKASNADVISLSGCKDGQTSADTFSGGVAVGAASHAIIKAIEEHPNQSYKEFLHNLRVILHPKYSQKPQLGSSHPIDTSLKFIM
ncbi:caspase domain-containing protein [Mycena haematopus]|nr:caspase domain-containing protein [Mycena haematopus]